MAIISARVFGNFRKRFDDLNPLFVGLVFLILVFFILFQFNQGLPRGDASEYCNNAYRFLKGDLPYKNFWLMFPPGEVYLPALVFLLFGFKYNFLYFFLMFSSVMIGFFSFFLARIFTKDNFWAMVLAIIVQFSGVPQFYGPNDGAHIYFLFLIIAAIFLFRDESELKRISWFTAGIFIGAASLFRFFETGAFGLSLICISFLRCYSFKAQTKKIMSGLIYLFVGVFLVLFLAYLPFLGMMDLVFREVVVRSVQHGTSGLFNLPYFYTTNVFFGNLLDALGSRGLFTLSGLINLVGIIWRLVFNLIYQLFVPLAAIALVFVLVKLKNLSDSELSLLFFLLWGIFSFPKAYSIPDRAHLAVAVTPLFFSLVLLIRNTFVHRDGIFGKKIFRFLLLFVAFLLFFSTPLFMAGSLAHGFFDKKHYAVFPEERITVGDAASAEEVEALVSFIEKKSEAGDYIFVSPFDAPPLYLLTQRRNPTYYDSTIDLLTKEDVGDKQVGICEELISKKTRLVIHSDCLFKMWGKCSSGLPILDECIAAHYSLNGSYGSYKFYVFRD